METFIASSLCLEPGGAPQHGLVDVRAPALQEPGRRQPGVQGSWRAVPARGRRGPEAPGGGHDGRGSRLRMSPRATDRHGAKFGSSLSSIARSWVK